MTSVKVEVAQGCVEATLTQPVTLLDIKNRISETPQSFKGDAMTTQYRLSHDADPMPDNTVFTSNTKIFAKKTVKTSSSSTSTTPTTMKTVKKSFEPYVTKLADKTVIKTSETTITVDFESEVATDEFLVSNFGIDMGAAKRQRQKAAKEKERVALLARLAELNAGENEGDDKSENEGSDTDSEGEEIDIDDIDVVTAVEDIDVVTAVEPKQPKQTKPTKEELKKEPIAVAKSKTSKGKK